jgi:hypothetical protein
VRVNRDQPLLTKTRSQSYQTFFCKTKFFPFFSKKLGRFIYCVGNIFLCYKHSSFTTKNGKQRKTKFGRIDSSFEFFLQIVL